MASGAAKAVILPEKEKKPKNSVVLSAGQSLASSVRLDDLDRPRGEPDQDGEGEIDLLADRGERRAAGELRLDGKQEQDVARIDRKHADRRENEQAQRPADHVLGAEAIVEQRRRSAAPTVPATVRMMPNRPSSEAPQPNTLAA